MIIIESSENNAVFSENSPYGLKQSPRCWYANLNSTLREYGFNRSEYDGYIYMRKVGDAVTYVTIYVDDIVIASNDDRTVAALKATLTKKYRITDAGRLENFLTYFHRTQDLA